MLIFCNLSSNIELYFIIFNNNIVKNFFTGGYIFMNEVMLSGVVFDLNISMYAKVVYFYLSTYRDENNKCSPCHDTIAKQVNCSVTKVQHAIKELIEAKMIQKENRFNNTHKGKPAQTSNEYTIYHKPYDQITLAEP